jgi:hypothetical protein
MNKFVGIAALIFISIIGSNAFANNVVYVPQQVVPVPVVQQVVVYQPPAYTVMVPVVVQPQPVIEQRVVWGYPYQVMTVPVSQYHWGYHRRCWPINRY